MGHAGGSSPKGTTQRKVSTLFLRAPNYDWAALTQSYKCEFRMPNMGIAGEAYVAPTLVVLYVATATATKTKLMALHEHRKERLIDMSDHPESLRNEGFASYDEFRSYWRARTRRPYDPTQAVEVFRISVYVPEAAEAKLGAALLQRLYGDYLR